MPDVHPEAYDLEDVSSYVRAIESAEQYRAQYLHKMVTEGLTYMSSGTGSIPAGDKQYSFVQNPSSNDHGIIAIEPSIQSDGVVALRGHFNPDVDESTFNQIVVSNLDSATVDAFSGNVYRGLKSNVTVNDTGNNFYNALVGQDKHSGGSVNASLIVFIQPGDSILMEIDNTVNGSSDALVGFQAPYHEQTEEFEL